MLPAIFVSVTLIIKKLNLYFQKGMVTKYRKMMLLFELTMDMVSKYLLNLDYYISLLYIKSLFSSFCHKFLCIFTIFF